MAPLKTESTVKKDVVASATELDVTLDTMEEGQELQWIDSDSGDDEGSLLGTITKKASSSSRRLVSSVFRKNRLSSRVKVLSPQVADEARNPCDDWDGHQPPVDHLEITAIQTAPSTNDGTESIEHHDWTDDEAPAEKKSRFKFSRKGKSTPAAPVAVMMDDDGTETVLSDDEAPPKKGRFRRSRKGKSKTGDGGAVAAAAVGAGAVAAGAILTDLATTNDGRTESIERHENLTDDDEVPEVKKSPLRRSRKGKKAPATPVTVMMDDDGTETVLSDDEAPKKGLFRRSKKARSETGGGGTAAAVAGAVAVGAGAGSAIVIMTESTTNNGTESVVERHDLTDDEAPVEKKGRFGRPWKGKSPPEAPVAVMMDDDGTETVLTDDEAPRKSRLRALRVGKSKRSNRGAEAAAVGAGAGAGAGVAALTIMPTKRGRKKKNAKKGGEKTRVQYFQPEVIGNDAKSESSLDSSEVESIRVAEKIDAKLKSVDDASIESIGGVPQYHKPRSPPRQDGTRAQPASPDRPTFVAAPKLDARIMTADSWGSLAEGGSLTEIISLAEEEEAKNASTMSLDGFFVRRRRRSGKKKQRGRRGKNKKHAHHSAVLIHIMPNRDGQEEEVEQPILWNVQDKEDEDEETGPPILWTITKPASLAAEDNSLADDRSALTMDEAFAAVALDDENHVAAKGESVSPGQTRRKKKLLIL